MWNEALMIITINGLGKPKQNDHTHSLHTSECASQHVCIFLNASGLQTEIKHIITPPHVQPQWAVQNQFVLPRSALCVLACVYVCGHVFIPWWGPNFFIRIEVLTL